MSFSDPDLSRGSAQVIRDALHGTIRLHDHEVVVIDHPLFQRLRFICQNDILGLVFPGATHSRFIHSIGAMHVADRMFSQLVHAHLIDAPAALPPAVMAALVYLNRCLRLAMLLHDSGHGSFSHQMEYTPEVAAMMRAPGRFERLWAGVEVGDLYPEAPRVLHHEHYSVRAAARILESCAAARGAPDARDVLSLMETTTPALSARFREAAAVAWPVFAGPGAALVGDAPALLAGLLRAIVSGELDADKADYILRDATNCSVSYGQINLDALINALRCGWIPEENWLGLVIQAKGVPNFEDFVHSRHQLYRHIYNHKTSVGFDLLLRRAIGELMEEPAVGAAMDRFLADIDAFADLTDTYFWERFREHAARDPESAAARIVRRRKLRHLGTHVDLPGFRVHDERRELAERLGVGESAIVHCVNAVRFSRISEGFADIKVQTRDPVDGTRAYRSLSETSDFFAKFKDLTLTHFYLDRPATSAEA